jgi:hypothetical protein
LLFLARCAEILYFRNVEKGAALAVDGVDRCQALFEPPPEIRRERPTW